MANRLRFNRDELDEYFDRICISSDQRIYDVSTVSDAQKLEFLSLVNKHHGCKVPWENLTQHYSWHRVINVQPHHLFRKIVRQPGRGGYCMENTHLFHTVLLSVNFHAIMVGSRIHDTTTNRYGGLTHIVNIVTIAGIRYMLDWGFGSEGPTSPIRLVHDEPCDQVAPAQMRLLYSSIPQNVDQSQRVWLYQRRYNPESAWMTYYCFFDLEFTPEDLTTMNFAPWLNRQSFFTHKVVAVRFTTDREINIDTKDVVPDPAEPQSSSTETSAGKIMDTPGSPTAAALEGDIDGAIVLDHDVLKWRRRGRKVCHFKLTTEAARVAALQRYFGIVLAPEDREAIQGTAAELGV